MIDLIIFHGLLIQNLLIVLTLRLSSIQVSPTIVGCFLRKNKLLRKSLLIGKYKFRGGKQIGWGLKQLLMRLGSAYDTQKAGQTPPKCSRHRIIRPNQLPNHFTCTASTIMNQYCGPYSLYINIVV